MGSTMKFIICICILFIQIPVVILLVFNYINKRKCINYGKTVKGRCCSVQSDRYLTVEYKVGSEVFKKKYLKKHYYDTSAEDCIQIKYLSNRPSFSFPQTFQLYCLSPAYDILALAFLFVADMLLATSLFANKEVFDFLFNTIMIVAFLSAVIVQYIVEFKLLRNSETTSGIIIAKGKEKNFDVFVAEYKLDGNRYYTREMKVPSKRNSVALNIGEEVEIKYISKRPHTAIISKDIYAYKNSKTFLLLALIVAIAIIFVYVIH